MTKKKNSSDNSDLLTGILSVLGGAAIAYVIAKAFSGGEHYECPVCHNTFQGKLLNCPKCYAAFSW